MSTPAVQQRGGGMAVFGPGLLVAATGVGAGDLVTAGMAGARLGVTILWAVVLGVVLKYVATEALARWQLGSGLTVLEAWRRYLHLHWAFLGYLVLWAFVTGGMLISACGAAAAAILPLGDDPETSKRLWGIVHALAGVALVLVGGYRWFERVMAGCVALMVLAVVGGGLVLATQIDWGNAPVSNPLLLDGGDRHWVFALLGGIGGTVTVLSYGYWIREERRGGAADVAVCRRDLAVGYLLTALFGVGMVLITAAVPDVATGEGQLFPRIARRLGEAVHPAAYWVFLLGAWATVFTSLLGVWQGIPYLFADLLREAGASHPNVARDLTRTPAYVGFLLFLAFPPLIMLWRTLAEVQLLYGLLGALFMPALAATLLILNNRDWLPREFRNGLAANVLLAATLLYFVWHGGLEIRDAVYAYAER